MEIYRVSVSRIEDLGDRVSVYYFDKPEGFGWDEGAHVHLALPGFNTGEFPDKALVRTPLRDLYHCGVAPRLRRQFFLGWLYTGATVLV